MWENQNMNDYINYKEIISKYPWIIKKNQKCILSPDSDGLLCGLLMSHFLNWEIVGFYDGKVLVLKNNEKASDCVFLDMEIFREYVKSLGHHMVLYNNRTIPENWKNFSNCIQPNLIRGYDGKTSFKYKYPLGAIHLLIGIVGYSQKIEIKKTAICPLLYTDGTFKNLFNYPENCLSWLSFLCANNKDNPLNDIFFNEHYTTSSLMVSLKDFFEKIKNINGDSRNDKVKISNTKGDPVNLIKTNDLFSLSEDVKKSAFAFLNLLSELTGWGFNKNKWNFDNFRLFKFKKGNIKPSNKRFNDLVNKNPLSWAMTSTLAIEYTLEEPDTFV